jgi:hypothetical protein
MRTTRCAAILIIFLALVACKKATAPITTVVEFKSTTYQTLGTFDASGKPDYLLPKDAISADLLSFVKQFLPPQDLRNTNPDLLNNKAIADIAISRQSDVFITFVSHGSGLHNAIAFYTYPTNNPPATANDIKVITYIFPLAGAGTTLQAGDKVKIGRFDAGTSLGFVLLQDGWDYANRKLNNKVPHFCSNDVLNPEIDPTLKKHAVLISYAPENKVLIGFEDLDRTTSDCDHDFNDVVLYATVTP